MTEVTSALPNAPIPSRGRNTELYRRYPTIPTMRKAARKKLPYFAFEYLDGGAGEQPGLACGLGRGVGQLDLDPGHGRFSLGC